MQIIENHGVKSEIIEINENYMVKKLTMYKIIVVVFNSIITKRKPYMF